MSVNGADPEFLADWRKWHPASRRPPGKLAHWCFDWDGLPIDEEDDEFSSCLCNIVGEHGELLKKGPSVFTTSALGREQRDS